MEEYEEWEEYSSDWDEEKYPSECLNCGAHFGKVHDCSED